jgi:hypothetical protein
VHVLFPSLPFSAYLLSSFLQVPYGRVDSLLKVHTLERYRGLFSKFEGSFDASKGVGACGVMADPEFFPVTSLTFGPNVPHGDPTMLWLPKDAK